jgi:hypothetical protein
MGTPSGNAAESQSPNRTPAWEGEGDSARAVVVGIEEALERATHEHATFSGLGLPWAGPIKQVSVESGSAQRLIAS